MLYSNCTRDHSQTGEPWCSLSLQYREDNWEYCKRYECKDRTTFTTPLPRVCTGGWGARWRQDLYYWPFVRGIHRLPVDSLTKDQKRGDLVIYFMLVWTSWWTNTRATTWRSGYVSAMLSKIETLWNVCKQFFSCTAQSLQWYQGSFTKALKCHHLPDPVLTNHVYAPFCVRPPVLKDHISQCWKCWHLAERGYHGKECIIYL